MSGYPTREELGLKSDATEEEYRAACAEAAKEFLQQKTRMPRLPKEPTTPVR